MGRPFRRPVHVQLLLDRYLEIPAPSSHCFINELPLELLVEILVHVSYDTTHTEQRHCDPFTLPSDDAHCDADDALAAKGACCIADLRFAGGCKTYCHTMPWNWLEVTRVCKTWYHAVRSSAEFCARVPVQTQDALSGSLQRAGAIPIRVHAVFDDHWKAPRRLASLLERELHRIGEIFVSWKTIKANERFDVTSSLRKEAPMLRSLRLCFSFYHAMWPQSFFCGVPPQNIRDVELDSVRLPRISSCSTLLAPTLTTLVLYNCSFETELSFFDGNPMAEEILDADLLLDRTFFDALAKMPLLESLSVINTSMPIGLIALEHDHFAPPVSPPTLSHLRELKLQGTVRVVTRLLMNIAIPSTTSLDICFQHRYDRFQTDSFIDLSGFRAFLGAYFRDAANSGAYYSANSMDLSLSSNKYTLHHAKYAFTAPRCPTSTHVLPSRIELGHAWDWEADYIRDICALAASLCEVIPCSGPEVSLEVVQVDPLGEAEGLLQRHQDWYQPAAKMVNLTSLHLHGYATTQFLKWIASQDTFVLPLTGDTQRSTRFSKLNSIELSDVYRMGSQDSTLSYLSQLMEHRPLTVTVRNCVVEMVDYNRMRSILGDRLHCERVDNHIILYEQQQSRFFDLLRWVNRGKR
ncbi:unnamed protein product [Peniophora sp. CBMAI 1063]|nr:unnamed protein product [Peniophora sp. CBMAI 1063]